MKIRDVHPKSKHLPGNFFFQIYPEIILLSGYQGVNNLESVSKENN